MSSMSTINCEVTSWSILFLEVPVKVSYMQVNGSEFTASSISAASIDDITFHFFVEGSSSGRSKIYGKCKVTILCPDGGYIIMTHTYDREGNEIMNGDVVVEITSIGSEPEDKRESSYTIQVAQNKILSGYGPYKPTLHVHGQLQQKVISKLRKECEEHPVSAATAKTPPPPNHL